MKKIGEDNNDEDDGEDEERVRETCIGRMKTNEEKSTTMKTRRRGDKERRITAEGYEDAEGKERIKATTDGDG
jgi:hypothetical protein